MKLRYQRVNLRGSAATAGRLDQLLEYLWDAPRGHALGTLGEWRPPVDVYQTPDRVEALLELAGLSEDAIEVTLFDDVLVVEGERSPLGAPCEELTYHEAGIRYGRFRAEIYLPAPVDADQAQARYEDGILKIILPKRVVGLRERRVGDGER
jgi:HSP20 family molecular chaperone IbpA